jgi:hypothetical protein
MKSPNRDLLVLLKDETMSEHAIEREVEKLNAMLFQLESTDNFCLSHELLDMNRYKISSDKWKIMQAIRQKELKPFTFLCNLN